MKYKYSFYQTKYSLSMLDVLVSEMFIIRNLMKLVFDPLNLNSQQPHALETSAYLECGISCGLDSQNKGYTGSWWDSNGQSGQNECISDNGSDTLGLD